MCVCVCLLHQSMGKYPAGRPRQLQAARGIGDHATRDGPAADLGPAADVTQASKRRFRRRTGGSQAQGLGQSLIDT